MPDDLRAAAGPEFERLPFTSLYLTDNEFAAEIANQTVHGVLHLGWVAEGDGVFRGQMAVYVRPNGLLGDAYMAAIKPFRYLVVYPQMLADDGAALAGTPTAIVKLIAQPEELERWSRHSGRRAVGSSNRRRAVSSEATPVQVDRQKCPRPAAAGDGRVGAAARSRSNR